MDSRYLYRGKRVDNGEWVYGHLVICPQGKVLLIFSGEYSLVGNVDVCVDWERWQIYPTTIGQCTGLSAAKSYRGTRPEDLLIFEGDKIGFRVDDETYITAVICWVKNDFIFGWGMKINNHFEMIYNGKIEIIGTIHD